MLALHFYYENDPLGIFGTLVLITYCMHRIYNNVCMLIRVYTLKILNPLWLYKCTKFQTKKLCRLRHSTVYHWPEQSPVGLANVEVKEYHSVSNRDFRQILDTQKKTTQEKKSMSALNHADSICSTQESTSFHWVRIP